MRCIYRHGLTWTLVHLYSLDSRRLGAGDSKNYLFFFFYFFYFSFFFFLFCFFSFCFFYFFIFPFYFFFYFSFFFYFFFFPFFLIFFFCLSSIKKNIINNLLFLPLCAGPVKPTIFPLFLKDFSWFPLLKIQCCSIALLSYLVTR